MKRQLILLLGLAACLSLAAQTTRKEMYRHLEYTGSNYCSYFGGKTKLSKAPEGYKPFYISHYGRHGSRYMLSNKAYHETIAILQKADSAGVLTKLGKKTLRKLRVAYADATGRAGELTRLGGRQHEGIAERMYHRFPEVFTRGSRIQAYSTLVHRCQESMQFFCGRLKHLNHDIDIYQRTDKEDSYFMQFAKVDLPDGPLQHEIDSITRHLEDSLYHSVDITPRLFTDLGWIDRNVKDRYRLTYRFYDIASDMQCVPELKLSFTNLFTKEELYNLWYEGNYGWSVGHGFMDGTKPRYLNVHNLLRHIMEAADKGLKQDHSNATLRFGHDTYVVPLAYLFGFDGVRQFPDPAHLRDMPSYYTDFRVTPMGANIQLIFFRKPGSDDVLVQFMLNEVEKTLPIASDCAPFYHWKDVRAFIERRLAQVPQREK